MIKYFIRGEEMQQTTITLKVSDKTKEQMVDYFLDLKREKTPPYAVFQAQDGDTVVIAELSRVSRSTSDTIEIVEQIRNKGASIKSLSETWLDTTSDNPASTLLLTIFAGLVQFERDLTSARVKDGLAAAKRRGHVGGRPSKKNQHYDAIVAMRKGGMGVSEIAKHVGVSNMTVYRVLRDSEDK